jgi:hypothetical protein
MPADVGAQRHLLDWLGYGLVVKAWPAAAPASPGPRRRPDQEVNGLA